MVSINRKAWEPEEDFEVTAEHVWHKVLGYSLSNARLVELEVRLLEKEWIVPLAEMPKGVEHLNMYGKYWCVLWSPRRDAERR